MPNPPTTKAAAAPQHSFFAEFWEDGKMIFKPCKSVRAAAEMILTEADWSDERTEHGLTRLHSAIYMQFSKEQGRGGDLYRVGMASNYCRRALEIAVETDDYREVIRRSRSENLTYETGL